MSQQPGYPYGQPQPGQYQGYPGAAGPNYAAPGAPQHAQYSTPGAQQAQPYVTPGGPQSQPYATPGAPQSQPYGTPSGAHPTPYSTPGIPQTTPHGAPPSHQQAYSTPDVVQHTAYGAQPQMPGYGVPMAGNPYGTQAPAPAPAPTPTQPVDPMWASFSAVAGADQKIDAVELCKCLTQSGFTGSYKPFTQETCKILITLLDRNKTGKMGFTEYKELWVVLGKWKQTFESLDKDRSGSLDEQELKSAIISFGYSLSPTALASVMQRYNTNGKIYFDDFIALTTRVRSLSAFFRSRDTTGQGTATLGYDDFIAHAMAC